MLQTLRLGIYSLLLHKLRSGLAVLGILREPEASDAKRAAIRVAAQQWNRPEAKAPLLELLRLGDPLWKEAARGLASLGAPEALDHFVALVDSGRRIDPDEAGALYFAFSGVPDSYSIPA